MPQRTPKQNKALHLYCELLAEELNAAGLDMKEVLKPEVDIPWEKRTVKKHLWKPIQKAMLGKEHTQDLENTEVTLVYDTMNRHLGEKFGVHVPFPTEEQAKEYYAQKKHNAVHKTDTA